MRKSFVERRKMKMKMNAMKFAIPLFVALAYGPAQGLAQSILGPQLATFAVLGETSVTNVPTSTIVGNVGVSAGVSITGFGTTIPLTATSDPQVTGGLIHTTTGLAAQAQVQLDAAILTLNNTSLFPSSASLGGNINGTYAPGVYDGGAGLLTGALTLDGSLNGAAPDVWVFRFASSLTTAASGSSVSVVNVGDGSDVGIYWVVGDFATLNGPTFAGNVLAQKTISSDGALTLGCGRLLSATADVTLIGDTISAGCFGTLGSGSGGFDQGNSTAPIPEPEIYAMMAVGLGLLGWVGRRKKLKEAAAA
jgi:hypothetical protein